VQFRPDPNYLGTKRIGRRSRTVILVPDIQTYQQALQAFLQAYSCTTPAGQPLATCPLPTDLPPNLDVTAMTRVSTLSPWGEPDFDVKGRLRPTGARDGWYYMPVGTRRFGQLCTGSVDRCGPVLAAQMWVAAFRGCHGCTIVAGTFGSNPAKSLAYLKIYAKNLDGLRPGVWAIDAYTDIGNYEYDCWDGHPPSSKTIGKYPAGPHNPPNQQCPAPAEESTLVSKFSAALAAAGYHGHTRIWLGEISVFYIDTITHPGAWYGWQVEHQAADYLLKQLARPGASTLPGDPYVARLYYMRDEDGAGYPDFALVLDNTTGHQEGPVAPGAEWRTPAYAAFRFRSSPQR